MSKSMEERVLKLEGEVGYLEHKLKKLDLLPFYVVGSECGNCHDTAPHFVPDGVPADEWLVTKMCKKCGCLFGKSAKVFDDYVT